LYLIQMYFFKKNEFVALIVIFLILLGVSIPNFAMSVRRSRDQVRRDDLGSLMGALEKYKIDFGVYPRSSSDGKIVNCLQPGEYPYQDEKGVWILNTIPCRWGVDAFSNLLTKNTYMNILPRDPKWDEGRSYLYLSDGDRYQILAAMEGKDEPEIYAKIISENLMCGNDICNVVRSQYCDFPKSLETCALEDAESKLKK